MTTTECRHAKDDGGGIYSEMPILAHVDAVTLQNELLVFLWIDFNAVKIVRTTTINSTCLLILVEICCEMTILQQVEIVFSMPNFRSIATGTEWLLHEDEDHIKGFPYVSTIYKQRILPRLQICNFVTAFAGECRFNIELREHLNLCFVVIVILLLLLLLLLLSLLILLLLLFPRSERWEPLQASIV